MLSTQEQKSINKVRKATKKLVDDAYDKAKPVLIEAPPNSGKTTSAIEAAVSSDKPVTYLAGRTDLYEEAKQLCDDLDLRYEVIPSPHRHCPTFRGENAGDEGSVAQLYNKGYSGRKVHSLPSSVADTPCNDGQGRCEYIQRLRKIDRELSEIDLLVGHHKHSQRPSYVKGRVVILDEFNPDPFLERYPSPETKRSPNHPGDIVRHFLERIAEEDEDFPAELNDLTDLIVKRHDSEVRQEALDWFKENGASQRAARDFDFLDVTTYRHDAANLIAPFLTLSILCMEKLSPGIERAPPTDNQELYDEWIETGVRRNWKCIRDRNTGEMYVLKPPLLEGAAQVIGLDALPSLELWNLVFGADEEFQHETIIPREDLATYLDSALNMTLVQIGDGMHHYAGGRISNRDEQRFRTVQALEQGRFTLISTKKALKEYERRGLIEKYVKNGHSETDLSPVAKNYATVRSSNEFEKERLGVVSGTPYPGDDIVELWSGLCGQPTSSEGSGIEKSFEGIGEEVFRYFTHHQVIQAVLRFGRHKSVINDGGSTIYVNTKAVPAWFSPTTEIEIQTDKKQTAIVETLIHASHTDSRKPLSQQTVNTLVELLKSRDDIGEISEEHVRETLRRLHDRNLITVRENAGRGGADLFQWDGDEFVSKIGGEVVLAKDDYSWILSSDAV
ncbi:hypothetical protein [Haloterrigena alkaliphila]|uniref:Uncharacterized protein n=1 Tax=Haloterrigena alkaliphila TaxID=2816475 RepID=A0A8A2VIY5_9EURY|nr:hypothetical protein [Haloterrigena alkaliphila]QSW98168.1 hypothetical protein J0X25_12185 [Haloterrigena alkaliphila]